MVGMIIIGIGLIFLFMGVLLRQRQTAAFLARQKKDVISVEDLTRWWKLNFSCLGIFVLVIGIASLCFAEKSPWIFVGAASFIMLIFGSMAVMGVKLLEKKEPSKNE